ncbi:MAG: biotin--[acetyl-CoA-carboxylase] ligase [Candidatus Methylomirabilales bacterium]
MGEVPADLAPDAIRAGLRTRVIGRVLEVHDVVDSTNDLAMAAGERGAAEGLCILADRQAAGRGRRGRTWMSLPGLGLYASILLRPGLPAERGALITLAAGVAAAEAVGRVSGVPALVKWPNDVVLDGRKVAGILTEATTVGAELAQVVVGIGINCRHRREDFPEELRDAATSIALAAGRPVERQVLAAALFNALDGWYAVLCRGDAAAVVRASRAVSAILGREVTVLAEGRAWRGVAVNIDETGALLVQDAGGAVRRLVSEEVSVRAPSA